jgi:hypothetical protein
MIAENILGRAGGVKKGFICLVRCYWSWDPTVPLVTRLTQGPQDGLGNDRILWKCMTGLGGLLFKCISYLFCTKGWGFLIFTVFQVHRLR